MKFYHLLCAMLALCILLCGCSGAQSNSSTQDVGDNTASAGGYNMQLIYDQTDTFNPFTAESKQNKELCLLLYDPLVTIDSSFSPVFKVAQSVSVSGKTCTIKLGSIKFSDGSALTANDVLYSLNLALSSPNYKHLLGNIYSKSVTDSSTVTITLHKADPYFANLLTFPIIKAGSDELKSGDNLALPPIGCGRYTLNETQTALIANKLYYGGDMNIKNINLINAPDAESAEHYVSTGAISVCYDDYSDSSVPRMSGVKKSVPLNNLVYIGVNMKNTFLKDKHLRYAISSALDRTAAVKDAYYDNATAATGPFNPLWSEAEGFQTLQIESNKKIAIENLEKIGYNSIDNEGYRLNSSGKRVSLSLLVNSDNAARMTLARLIVKQLAAVGLEIKIRAVPYSEYISLLKSGSFELYIAEVNLLCNMDLSQLVVPGGSMAFGISLPAAEKPEDDKAEQNAGTDGINLTSGAAVQGFYEGKYTLGDVASAFISEMPIIPICYRNGVIMFTHKLKTEPQSSACDIFFDISNYSFNNQEVK